MTAPVDEFDLDIRLGTHTLDIHGSADAYPPPTYQLTCPTNCPATHCRTGCDG
jgi:hypothetical protein